MTDGQEDTDSVAHTVVAVAPNQVPTAAFQTSLAGFVLSVDGGGSSDPDGSVASYAWVFGDGESATTATATTTHTYARAGTYSVSLTVKDNKGASSTQLTKDGRRRSAESGSGGGVHVEHGRTWWRRWTDRRVRMRMARWRRMRGRSATVGRHDGVDGVAHVRGCGHVHGDADGDGRPGWRVGAGVEAGDGDGASAAAGNVVATDLFERTGVNGWGSADAGGAWTVTAPASRYSVAGGAGVITIDELDGGAGEPGGCVEREQQAGGVVLGGQGRECAVHQLHRSAGGCGAVSAAGPGRGGWHGAAAGDAWWYRRSGRRTRCRVW